MEIGNIPTVASDGGHTSLSRIGQDLSQVPDLTALTRLRSLCLHGNNITRIEGIQHLSKLVDLNLSSNAIVAVDPGSLRGLTSLTSLNLASNRLQSIQGLEGLSRLEQLNLSYNYITSISGLTALQGPLCKLRVLNLKHNQLQNLQSFSVLVGCINLRWLQVAGNPVCQLPNCMQALAAVLPHVTQLDAMSNAEALTSQYDMQAAQQLAAIALKSFEPLSPPLPRQQHPQQFAGAGPVGPNRTTHTALQAQPTWQLQRTVISHEPPTHQSADAQPHQLSAALARPQQPSGPDHALPLHPEVAGHIAPAMLPPHTAQQTQQQQLLVASQSRPDPQRRQDRMPANLAGHRHSGEVASGNTQPPHDPGGEQQWEYPPGRHGQEQPQRRQTDPEEGAPEHRVQRLRQWQGSAAPVPASAQGAGVAQPPQQAEEASAHDTRPAPDQQPQQPQSPVYPPARPKAIMAEAAIQTSEYTPLVRRLQAEAEQLRKQLMTLTDELERRNGQEDSFRQAMQDAVTAAQEDAHRKVEDGFREASFAVSKAVHELESARRAANEAHQRIAQHARGEEEQRLRCAGLDKDVARLHDEVSRLNQHLRDQQASAAAAVDEERRRAAETEASLRTQLAVAQAAAAELQTARAAAQAAEQKAAGLESALAQSSSVTVSMTAKIAQTMADANAQIDVLKARIASAEQQLAEYQRREVDSRAEINTLTAALTTARQAHERELEGAARQHEEGLKAERERVSSEERSRTSAYMQAQHERAGLQEQIAFLKVQLQFAIKESEKEQQAAQQALRGAQAEAAELRTALQAAAMKQREGESLVSDFTAVVQQQKAAIQGMQREKEALSAKLRACGPEQLEALAAENVALKRAAAERDLYREQVDDARRRWQEAERRITELQVSSSRSTEELAAKVRATEAALAAARDEAARAEAAVEKLRHEVAAQQDIVKIKTAMVDSANETIASLKAEVADLQVEADEARRAAEEAEAALSREQHDEDAEKERLRSDAQANEAAAAAARSALGEAQARLKEAEGRLRGATEAVAEKDRMIKYVEEEVDRVKGLFEKREQRLRDERDAARADAAAALAARDAAEGQLAAAAGRVERLARELDLTKTQLAETGAALEAARREAAAAGERAEAARAEAAAASARVAEAEGEMRSLLAAVERQKASSANKMKQLASLLQEL